MDLPAPTDKSSDLPGYRTLPFNEEAERAVLGAILTNNAALERVADFLTPEHFYIAVNGRVFEAIQALIQRGVSADPVTLRDYFREDPDLEAVGGAGYLVDLASAIVSVVNVEDYARIVFDLALRRSMIRIGEEMVNRSYEHDLGNTTGDLIETAEQDLFILSQTGSDRRELRQFSAILDVALGEAEAAMRRDTRLTGVTTGLREMDKRLGGLQKSDLLILAGRPAMGKTALATNIAFNAAHAFAESNGAEGAQVAFFSLEMSAEQLALRILSDRTEISSELIRKGEIDSEKFLQLTEAYNELLGLPLWVDDTAGLTIGQMRTRARRLFARNARSDEDGRRPPQGLIVVDYLQLMRPGANDRSDGRVQEISEITRGLKMVAKDLNVPVIALSQLSRAVEQREDKRPQLADLRESGSIEQDADVVMFVYREEYYLHRQEPEEGTEDHIQWQEKMAKVYNKAEVIVGKQRHGPTGVIPLFFDGRYTRFADLDQIHSDSDFA